MVDDCKFSSIRRKPFANRQCLQTEPDAYLSQVATVMGNPPRKDAAMEVAAESNCPPNEVNSNARGGHESPSVSFHHLSLHRHIVRIALLDRQAYLYNKLNI